MMLSIIPEETVFSRLAILLLSLVEDSFVYFRLLIICIGLVGTVLLNTLGSLFPAD